MRALSSAPRRPWWRRRFEFGRSSGCRYDRRRPAGAAQRVDREASDHGVHEGRRERWTAVPRQRDVVLGPDVDQVEIALVPLIVGGIGDELAIDASHANRADRSRERDIAHTERCGCAIDREHVGIILSIRAQENGDDLGVVEIAGGEEGTQWAIRHSRGEGFLLGRTAFALEITAGKFSDGCRFLAVIDGEREEVLTFLDFGRGDGAGQHHGVAAGNDDGAVSQLRDFASLNGDWEGPDLGRDLVLHILLSGIGEFQAGHP